MMILLGDITLRPITLMVIGIKKDTFQGFIRPYFLKHFIAINELQLSKVRMIKGWVCHRPAFFVSHYCHAQGDEGLRRKEASC